MALSQPPPPIERKFPKSMDLVQLAHAGALAPGTAVVYSTYPINVLNGSRCSALLEEDCGIDWNSRPSLKISFWSWNFYIVLPFSREDKLIYWCDKICQLEYHFIVLLNTVDFEHHEFELHRSTYKLPPPAAPSKYNRPLLVQISTSVD